MKVVLDPNVVISALLSTGTTAAVLDAWINERSYEPVICPQLLDELEEVLSRPKFGFIDRELIRMLMDRLRSEAIYLDDPVVVSGATSDPDDDYLVALAREADAPILVSGDLDLHAKDSSDVRVLSPRAFLDQLAGMRSWGGAEE